MGKKAYGVLCICIAALLATGCFAGKDKGKKEDTSASTPTQSGALGVYDEIEERIISGSLIFAIDGEEASVTGYCEEDVEEIDIPDTLVYENKSYKVTSIAAEALSYQLSIKSVTIPETITSIGKEAFCGCELLESIDIPDSVTSLGNGAFYDCVVLKSCTLGKGITSLPNEIFTNCYELKDFTVSDTIVAIGAEAFWGCESIKKLDVPESVVSIGDRAFYGSGIRQLTIASKSISMADDMLEGMNDLKKLYVDKQFVRDMKENLNEDVKVQGIKE